MKILAAVVTYNRSSLLSRCLDHLLAQTRAADAVLVVNNGSTDDTEAMLAARGVPFVTQANVGSAGGWHRSIAHALEHGFDAVWLMDDDGYPDRAALAVLEAACTDGVACASAVVVQETNPEKFVFPFPVLDERGDPVLIARRRKITSLGELAVKAQNGTYPFAHFFNGALLSIEAVRQTGNIDRDFFIFGDEVDYFYRLRRAGKVVSVLAAKHYHPDVAGRPYTLTKVYYYIKNTIVLNGRYFRHPVLRNAMTPLVALARTGRRNGWAMALSLVAGRQAPTFYSAIARGLKGRVGKDYDG